jgi:pimeloyl-ACP methyl ester carboxylesterase
VGHFVTLEAPDELAREIDRALASNAALTGVCFRG